MSERKWTDAQIDAISHDGKRILVSAGAGSGKTAVLTERILRRLTDPAHPADLGRIAVVTFTNDSADELKERIGKTLLTALAENPGNRHLRRQYLMLGKAKISTIDGFCLGLIRENFERLGLSPTVEVADLGEASLMRQQAANAVIDGFYAALPGYDTIDNFAAFADNFVTPKNDRLSDVLLSLYEKVSSLPRGSEFLSDAVEEMKKAAAEGIEKTVFGKEIFRYLTEFLSAYRSLFEDACDCFLGSDPLSQNYYPSFRADLDFLLQAGEEIKTGDLARMKGVFLSYQPIPLKKGDKSEEAIYFKGVRDTFKAQHKKLVSLFFTQDTETIRRTAEKSADFLEKLYRFLKAFELRYSADKRERDLLDFGDLKRFAYRLLCKENGEPTEAAKEISSRFDEIYIDEYQDVDRIQDAIFSALSFSARRFMVGDIKQSIYRFRGAEPSLFTDYRRDGATDKVYLRHNFRCDKPIIDFVNAVCGPLFRTVGKTVPYGEEDELVCGKEESGVEPVEILLVEAGKVDAATCRAKEAEAVAERIAKMLREGRQPADFAILIRSLKTAAPYYEEALKKRGIPCRNQEEKELLVCPEVLLAMNLLSVIDNPTRDIPLAGLLKSPIYNFTLSELVAIRRSEEKGPLFSALKSYTEKTGFEKGRHFLEKLEQYRALAGEPVDRLLWFLFCDTHLFALTADAERGNVPKENLLMLHRCARDFERGQFKGLYRFIRYANDLLEKGEGFSPAPSPDAENAVAIKSIHRSKGLEFPVVFVSDCATAFSDADVTGDILLDREGLVTLKLSDETGFGRYPTVFRSAEALGITERAVEEELRILYVALTRAKSKLIVTASLTDASGLTEECRMTRRYLSEDRGFLLRTSPSYIRWILTVAGDKFPPSLIDATPKEESEDKAADAPSSPEKEAIPGGTAETKTAADAEKFSSGGLSVSGAAAPGNFDGSAVELETHKASSVPGATEPLSSDAAEEEEEITALAEEYGRRFSFVYPHTAASALPAKLSVSELYPSLLDDYGDALRLSDERERNMTRPAFLSEKADSAADRGTATHQFMQFCDFALLERNGVESEISRLLAEGFLDTHTASLIEREKAEAFLGTPLFHALRTSPYCKRELRFNILLPAVCFTEEPEKKALLKGEKVLVQGIMDCVFLDEKGRLTVLDYKTDRIPASLRDNRKEAEELLIRRHKRQLSYYCAACRQTFCRPADRVLLYSFSLAEAIEIPLAALALPAED